MMHLKTALAAALAAGLALALSACDTTSSGNSPRTGAQAEVDNASNINSNGSAQPGGAGPSPNGGASNPGTSGSVAPPRPH